MSDDFRIQANFKSGVGYDASLINVRASSADEFKGLVEYVIENAPLLAAAKAALTVSNVLDVAKVQVTATPAPQQAPQTAPGFNLAAPWDVAAEQRQAPQHTQQAPPSWAAPAQANHGGETVTDKWGKVFEYGRPDAPATPRGPAVLKSAVSQAGKEYKRWEDPAKGPKWYPQPKPADHELWPGEFYNGK